MRRLRKLVRGAALAAALVVPLVVAGRLILQSAWFGEQVRQRIVREMEIATGGRAQMASFSFDWSAMRASVRGLTLHGLEPPGEDPLLRIEHAAVELKIVSLLRRKVDLRAAILREPRLHLRRDAQGRWNLPRPALRRSPRSPFEVFVDLAIDRVQISRGLVQLEDKPIPLEWTGHNFELRLAHDGAAYNGQARVERLHVTAPFRAPLDFDAGGRIRMHQAGLDFTEMVFSRPGTKLTATGRLTNWRNPAVHLTASGTAALADLVKPLRLPVAPAGEASVRGAWTLLPEIRGQGTIEAAGVRWVGGGITVAPVALRSRWLVTRTRAEMEDTHVTALGGSYTGRIIVDRWKTFELTGDLAELPLANLYGLWGRRDLPWRGMLSGPVRLTGSFTALHRAEGDLALEPVEGGTPVQGRLGFSQDWAANRLAFSPSHIELPHSRLSFSGPVHQRLEIGLLTRDLDELLPAARLIREGQPGAAPLDSLPTRIEHGTLRFDGVAAGRAGIEGRLAAGPLRVRNVQIDHVSARIAATASDFRLAAIEIRQGAATVTGELAIAMADWSVQPTSAVRGSVQVSGARLERLLGELGQRVPVAGTLDVSARISGTRTAPVAEGHAEAHEGSAWGEKFDRLSFRFRTGSRGVELSAGRLSAGAGSATFTGSYQLRGSGWQDGSVRFQAGARGLTIRQWAAARSLPGGLDGELRMTATGTAEVSQGAIALTGIEGELAAPALTLSGRPLGEARVAATTKGRTMFAGISARVLGSEVNGEAEWSLLRNSFGLGQIRAANVTVDNLQQLGVVGEPGQRLPASGTLDLEFAFSGPVLRPANWNAVGKVTRIEIEPRLRDSGLSASISRDRSRPARSRFGIRNEGPLTGIVDRRGFTIQSARLVGEGTDLDIAGSFAFGTKSPWNVRLRGTFNLPGLSLIEPDLVASGQSSVDATVRGALDRPQITGRMELRDASFNLRGLPNGLDRMNGAVRFDRTRATIEKLTAQTGGGDLSLAGFVGFGGEQLLYRLQASAQRVRVRYPEAVSTTFDADVSLTGTASQSLLAGTITVTRLGLRPQTDIGGLLAESARAAQAGPAPNAFVRGMQLDVRVLTSTGAELQTSLTRDIQPDADIRIRGTAARPVALGRVAINEGEINFFGNRYTITRGEIGFFNPTRIEPVLSFDLETRVRGIVVTLNLAGPIGKLNFSYRSDPPLQSSEIIALLTVGRAPSTTAAAPSGQSGQSFLQSGGTSLLGNAIAAPISGRLQRFFGVSRLKIDPELNTLTNTPQARLTVEQQLSREVTVTYITSLNRAQNQIVRVQWDFSREFSVLAVRDENGLFGIDFQYRRRFR